jgi:hypothetical protein
MAILKNTTVDDTGFLQLPVGTTGQRPSVSNGRLRFNSTTGKVEFYNTSMAAWLGTPATGIVATGGTVYDVDAEGTTYRVHVFTTIGNSTFTVTKGGPVEYLIVAGGGGGGGWGGGGGAGGLLTGTTTVTTQSYTVTVGGGGARGTTAYTTGGDGGSSAAFSLTAIGGGGGGAWTNQNGRNGGSGGGGSGTSGFGLGTAGQGNNGGAAPGTTTSAPYRGHGGGGGAGFAGQAGNQGGGGTIGGDGGLGLISFLSGTSTFYAGGGGGHNPGANDSGRSQGGLGGGGRGGRYITPVSAEDGTPNTGGGGGGSYGISGSIIGLGGSGIVIIRYPLRQENSTTAAGKVIVDGLALDFDFAKPTATNSNRHISNALSYRWFAYSSALGNPSPKASFDALFNVVATGSGIDPGRSINWPDVASRPTYITQTDYFAWEVSGLLFAPRTGIYSFSTRSDDGNQLTINDQIVTEFYGGRGVPVAPGDVGTINLSAGFHQFRYRMQQGGGGAGAIVSWIIPGGGEYVVIPSSNFSVPQIEDARLNGITGTLFSQPVFTDPRTHRSSFNFNGISSLISIPHAAYQNSSSLTLAAWINVNTLAKSTNFFGKSGNNGYRFRVNASTGILIFFDRGGTNAIASSTAITINTWNYVVATASPSGLQIYINGILRGSNSTAFGGNTQTTPLVIGAENATASFNESFSGNIATASLYTRVLSATEISQNYNATRWRFGV